ncbi:MAG: pyridoxal phosphate-dependent aminotransferase [Bacteroidota bacterium]|nr:pyridoxal phosphate-dependent aminotransferase [Bacteroidota bacterium]
MTFSKLIQRVPTSSTIKMAQMAREKRQAGKEVINLTLGEPDFPTPDFIVEAGAKALRDGFTKYTPVPGLLSLREAISSKLSTQNNLSYAPDEIIVSTGAKQSIANAVLTLVNPGEVVLLPVPYWVSYAGIAKMAGAEVVPIPTGIDQQFKITPAQLESTLASLSASGKVAKMLIFSSPSNPSGMCYSQEELDALSKVIEKHTSLWVLTDEIYEHINFTGKPHASIAKNQAIRDQVLIVTGMSKGYCMTGWRIGYLAGPKDVVKACSKLQGQFTSGTSAAAQKGAEAALLGPLDETLAMRDAFVQRRDYLLDALKDFKGWSYIKPDGAFYLFINIQKALGLSINGNEITSGDRLAELLLDQLDVALVGGSGFGEPNAMRISYAASIEDLEKMVSRLAPYFS